MRTYQPVEGVAWKERMPGEMLPPQDDRAGGRRPAEQRCGAIGLIRGDCDQDNVRGQVYCAYHEKLRLELLEPSAPVYPVWPLPAMGYRILKDDRKAAA